MYSSFIYLLYYLFIAFCISLFIYQLFVQCIIYLFVIYWRYLQMRPVEALPTANVFGKVEALPTAHAFGSGLGHQKLKKKAGHPRSGRRLAAGAAGGGARAREPGAADDAEPRRRPTPAPHGRSAGSSSFFFLGAWPTGERPTGVADGSPRA